MDISKEGAKIGYKIVNATAYEPAKIVFSSNEEVKLVTELSGRFYASKNYNTTYSKEIIVSVSGDAGSLDDTFVFEDTLGNMTNVHVIGDIDVSNRYIVTVKTPAKSIYDTYAKEITLGRANSLVVKMKNAKKVNVGKVSAYYGLDFTEIRTSVSTEDDFNVAKTLGGAISLQVANRDKTVVELQKGNVEIVTAAQSSASSVNGNLTGIYIESGLVTGGGNEDDKGSSFHVTIINK